MSDFGDFRPRQLTSCHRSYVLHNPLADDQS